MLPTPIRKEYLSRGYLTVIAGKSGIKVEFVRDDFGLDGYFSHVQLYKRRGKSRYLDTGCGLYFQVKSTTRWERKEENLIYDLEVKNYNDLVSLHRKGNLPTILILLCLPTEESEWLEINEKHFLLRECCYWHYISESAYSKNKETERIKIPREQIFNTTWLHQLLEPGFLVKKREEYL